jgi:3-methyladenine DNA glycosylase AlkD
MGFQSYIVDSVTSELPQLRNQTNAADMQWYMKDVAPFLGIKTPVRRATLKKIFKAAPEPTSTQLGKTARALWKLSEREYQYAACDMLATFNEYLDKDFLAEHGEYLITHKPWWDTVDSLGSAIVSPLTIRHGARKLMNSWNKSDDIWLIRAAIQHQRGRKTETDVPLLLNYCHDHAGDHTFWVAKAIGWALRDLAHFDRPAVTKFLAEHPGLDRVAVREALKHA